ncbi:MAG: lipid II flippase Amj family protein [Peptococcaceae bacterium]|nr:lipid II flippase Amj family protein [Peptococcaceae bacterium]
MTRLLIVAGLTAVIHAINTLVYGVRLAGVRTRRLATAISLFNIIFLISSTANLIQAPLLSSLVERAINAGLKEAAEGGAAADILASALYQQQLAILAHDMRLVIVAASIGTAIGAFLIPPFVTLFARMIMLFDEVGSVPRLIIMILVSPRRLIRYLRRLQLPRADILARARGKPLPLPRMFLFMNMIVTGIYTIGVLSALYAGALFPAYRGTAILLSGIVNGIATVMIATIIDPTAAKITDQALCGERPEGHVKNMVLYLTVTRFLGTVLAQVFFIPAALLIRYVTQIIV